MKIKLFLFALLITLVFSNSYSQQDVNGWYWMVGKPTGNTLNWVKIVDPANIYAVGNYGTFMKSNDGGDTWSINTQAGSPGNDYLEHRHLYTGWFFNANTGFVGGQSVGPGPGYISRTTDAGNTWTYVQYSATAGTVTKIFFINANTGYLTGNANARLYKTTDAGLTWTNISNVNGFPLDEFSSVYAVDENNIYLASTTNKNVYRYTTANGWTTTSIVGTGAILTDLIFKDANTGFVSGNGNFFAYTTNAGTTWIQSNAPSTVGQRDLDYTNGVLYMSGDYQNIYKSTNNGVTWSSVYFIDNANSFQPPISAPGIIYGISVNGSDMALVGQNGITNISNDAGNSWRNKNYSVNNNYNNISYGSVCVQTTGTGLPVTGNVWLGPDQGGNILYSSNAGSNWTTKPSPNISSVKKIQFVNANTGYISGGNSFAGIGEMSKTTNGGTSWTALLLPNPVNSVAIISMDFINANTGWVATEGGYSAKTTNGGSSWILQTLEPSTAFRVVNLQMLDANTGYAMASSLYKTTNGGTNWIKTTNPYILTGSWNHFYLYSKDVIFLYGNSPSAKKIVRSVDGGNTFTDITSNLIPSFSVLRAKWINLKHGVIGGAGGITARTTNGGLNWEQTNTGGSSIVGIDFPNKKEWYAVSDRNSAYEAWKKVENITSVSVNVTMGIEGFWNGSSMVTDDVTVELRNSTAPYALVDQATEKVNYHGYATYEFNNAPAGSYYIVLKHRNSLETWSSVPVAMVSAGNYDYNFTTSAAQSFGSNTALKSGVYCVFSGDINQDQTIDAGDLALVENANGNGGYLPEDVSGDDYVDAGDVALVENNKDLGIYVAQP